MAMPAAPPPVATEGGPEEADMPPTAGKHNAIDVKHNTDRAPRHKRLPLVVWWKASAEGPADITQKDEMDPPASYPTALPSTAADVQSEQDPLWLQQSA